MTSAGSPQLADPIRPGGRVLIGTTPCLLVTLLLGCAFGSNGTDRDQRPSRLNIVLVLVDDLGYGDLSSYGSNTIRTPNIDSLAAEGQRWTDFYVNAGVCSPSRAALLTGRLPLRTGLYGRRIPVFFPNDDGGIPADEVTLAEAFSRRGYRTAIFGKWHLGDAPASLPTRHGFDVWRGVPYSNDMDWATGPDIDELIRWTAAGRTEDLVRVTRDRAAQYAAPRRENWNIPFVDSRRRSDGTFADNELERSPDQAQLTQRAIDDGMTFISDARRTGAPFFLYLPLSMPHTPLFASDEFKGRSSAGLYADVVEEIDAGIGRLRSHLEQLELADETVVVFTSDNGPWLLMGEYSGSSGPLRHGKSTTFEGGFRVPAIIWGPGRVEPGEVSQLGTAMDLYPTLLALASAAPSPPPEADPALDGLDLSLVLRDPKAASPRTIVPYYRQGELRALRKGRWKIHRVTEGAYSMPPPRTDHDPPLLYDLSSDPGETKNVAARHPEVVVELEREMDRLEASIVPAEPIMDRRILRAMESPETPAASAPSDASEGAPP